MKPHLLDDWQQDRVVFPVIGQPKIDGVRALNMTGALTGRSLKPLKNRYLTSQFSQPSLIGFDGELAAELETHPALSRITSSATGTYEGQPWLLWHLFDYVTEQTRALPYTERMDMLRVAVAAAPLGLQPHLRVIPSTVLHDMDALEQFDADNLARGYEGTVLCGPNAPHKEGRAGKKLFKWRIKRFIDFEFRVHTILEGDANENEAQTNELGHTFRSSHQENKVPNGMVGAMLGTTLADVYDNGALIFAAGTEVRVSASCLTHEQRRYYFVHQDEFKALIHKAKFFPKGIKDKPRFPTWQSFRNAEEMSE